MYLFGFSIQTSKESVQKFHPELGKHKANIISLRMEANKQTDRHTRNSWIFWTSEQTSNECLQKNLEDISSRTGDIPI